MLLADFIRDGIARLETLYPSPEARGLVLMLCSERLGTTSYTHIIEPRAHRARGGPGGGGRPPAAAVRGGEPIQYVLGFAEFCGHRFAVGPGVLVPRPETEQLVGQAVSLLREMDLEEPPRVLDLCTGSGCIAWSIALEIRDAQVAEVVGVDLSPAALGGGPDRFAGPVPRSRPPISCRRTCWTRSKTSRTAPSTWSSAIPPMCARARKP